MLKMYCQCGSITEYTYNIPKFCSTCGDPFIKNETAAAPSKTQVPIVHVPPKVKRRPPIDIDPDGEDDLEDDYELEEEERAQIRRKVDLSNNPFEVEVSGPRRVKIKDIAKGGGKVTPVNKINVREQTKTKQSNKEFLKEWQAEAGTSRNKK